MPSATIPYIRPGGFLSIPIKSHIRYSEQLCIGNIWNLDNATELVSSIYSAVQANAGIWLPNRQ